MTPSSAVAPTIIKRHELLGQAVGEDDRYAGPLDAYLAIRFLCRKTPGYPSETPGLDRAACLAAHMIDVTVCYDHHNSRARSAEWNARIDISAERACLRDDVRSSRQYRTYGRRGKDQGGERRMVKVEMIANLGASVAAIDGVSAREGVVFPDALRALLLKHDGANVSQNIVSLGTIGDTCVMCLMPLKSIEMSLQNYEPIQRLGLVPFASDVVGGLFAVDGTGIVYYIDHEQDWPEAVWFASDIASFLAMLEPDD